MWGALCAPLRRGAVPSSLSSSLGSCHLRQLPKAAFHSKPRRTLLSSQKLNVSSKFRCITQYEKEEEEDEQKWKELGELPATEEGDKLLDSMTDYEDDYASPTMGYEGCEDESPELLKLSQEQGRKLKHRKYMEDLTDERIEIIQDQLNLETEPLQFSEATRVEVYKAYLKARQKYKDEGLPLEGALRDVAASFDISLGKTSAIVRLKFLEAAQEEAEGPRPNPFGEALERIFPEVFVDGIPGDSLTQRDPIKSRRPRSEALEESQEIAQLMFPRKPRKGQLGAPPPGEEKSTELVPGWRTPEEVAELRKKGGISHPQGGKIILMGWGNSAKTQPILIRELSGSVRTASWAERKRLVTPPLRLDHSYADQVEMTFEGKNEIIHHIFDHLPESSPSPVTPESPYSFDNLPTGTIRELLGKSPRHKKPAGRPTIRTKGTKKSYHKRTNKTKL